MMITQRNSESGRWHAIASGRVTTDARFDETQFGAKSTFSICYEAWMDDAKKWHNKYINCRATKELAAIASYLEKGDVILATGIIKSTTFTDKRTGEVKNWTELICDNIILPQIPNQGGFSETSEQTPFDSPDDDYPPLM